MSVAGLYQKHRPKTLRGIIGQPTAVSIIKTWVDKGIPHVILFTGPSGVGKTTLAKILVRRLDCDDADFYPMNIADVRGIDNIRDIRSKLNLAPIGGSCRVWLLDEIQGATRPCQEALLEMLENTPNHVYFLLCTTDPQKLLPTILTRCKTVELTHVSPGDLKGLVLSVAGKEGSSLPESVAERIGHLAQGSPRMALGLLENILWLPGGEGEQLEALESRSLKAQAGSLAQLLMKGGTTWPEVARVLRETDEDVEAIRQQILGYANAILISGKNTKPNTLERAVKVISVMQFNFFDSKKAGLSLACWKIVSGE